MILKTILPLFIAFLLLGCKEQVKKEEKANEAKTEIVTSGTVTSAVMAWANSLNSNDKAAIEKHYDAKAVKAIAADSILKSASEIARYYVNQKTNISAIESLFTIEAHKERGISYEIIRYTTDNQKEYTQLVIWQIENGHPLREFEFTEQNSPSTVEVATAEIAACRNLWLAHCNAHKTEDLVEHLYTANTIYFNHKPIIQGFDALISEYAYMNDPEYSLDLQPLKFEIVNAKMAFEIGQCSGSYNGKYILIWQKQTDGKWKIFIDSNI